MKHLPDDINRGKVESVSLFYCKFNQKINLIATGKDPEILGALSQPSVWLGHILGDQRLGRINYIWVLFVSQIKFSLSSREKYSRHGFMTLTCISDQHINSPLNFDKYPGRH